MRNIEEQLKEIALRSAAMTEERAGRKAAAVQSAAAAFCFMLLAAVSAFAAGVPVTGQGTAVTGSFGSLVITGPFAAYILVGFIAFLLGISFTMLCIHVQRNKRNR